MINGSPTVILAPTWIEEKAEDRCIKCVGLLYALGIINDEQIHEINAGVVDFTLRMMDESLDKMRVV